MGPHLCSYLLLHNKVAPELCGLKHTPIYYILQHCRSGLQGGVGQDILLLHMVFTGVTQLEAGLGWKILDGLTYTLGMSVAMTGRLSTARTLSLPRDLRTSPCGFPSRIVVRLLKWHCWLLKSRSRIETAALLPYFIGQRVIGQPRFKGRRNGASHDRSAEMVWLSLIHW